MNNYRRIFYSIIIISLSIYFNFSRIAIKFIRLPGIIEDAIVAPSKVVFIYGNPCTACASGTFLNSLRSQTREFKLIFVPSREYSQNDIVNLKRTFSLEGEFIKSDSFVEKTKEEIIKLAKLSKSGVGFRDVVEKLRQF